MRSGLQTTLVGGAAVVVLSSAAVVAGLFWGENGPAAEAAPGDVHTKAPGCDVIEMNEVEAVVPSAALEAADRGPLTDASGSDCAWTSLGEGAAPPRSVHVDFEAHFTDKAGDTSGERSAAEQLRRLAPVGDLEGTAPVGSLGEGAIVWPSRHDSGTAEVAFRSDNLVVRVFYGGYEDVGGQLMSYEAARDGAVAIAESVEKSL